MSTPALPQPQPGFAPAPVNSTEWNAQVVQAQAQAIQQATQNRSANIDTGFPLPDWIKTPIEWAGSKIHDVYSNYVSRPLSAALLEPFIVRAQDKESNWNNLFDGDTWDQAWRDAKTTSPGQAFTFGAEHFFDTTDQIKQAMKAPVIYKPTDMAGKPVIDQTGKPVQVNLNQTGVIWDNPDAVRVQFDSGIQKWVSGGVDAAIGWYADPLALGGKALGTARDLAYVRPAMQTENKTFAGQVLQFATGGRVGAPKVTDNIQKNLDSSAFTAMGDMIMKGKSKLGAIEGPTLEGESLPGSRFEEWVARQNWAKNSADAGALASALGKASDRDEVNQILAIAMGDRTATQALTAQNAELGAQLQMLERQKQGAISNFPENPTVDQQAKYSLQMKDFADQMSAIDSQIGSIGSKVQLLDSMKNGMYFNPLVSPIASNFGQYARGLQTAQYSSTATPIALVYNNLYVKPIRLITGTTWNGIRAPGHIDLNAEDSYRALGAQLEQAKVYSPDEVRGIVSKYISSDASARSLLMNQVDRNTTQLIASKHGLTPAEADKIYGALGGLRGRATDGQIYSTAYINTADGGSIRADRILDDGGVLATTPILNTQLENTRILHDYEHMDRVLKFTATPFKRIMNDEEISQRAAAMGPLSPSQMQSVADSALEKLPGAPGARVLRAMDFSSDAMSMIGKLWKFNVLLRLGYGPRALSDDFLGQIAKFGAYDMFVDRALKGGRNMMLRNWNRTLNDVTGFQQQDASLESGINILTQRSQDYQDKIDRVQGLAGAGSRSNQIQRVNLIKDVQAKLDDTQNTLEALKAQRNKLGETKNTLGDQYVIMPDGTAFPRPFEGPTGALFRDLNSDRRTVNSVMGGTASDLWNTFRQGAWSRITSSDPGFKPAWLRDVQHQIANDKAAQQVLQGKDLEAWFGTPEGRAYRKASAIQSLTTQDHADRITQHVNMYLPDTTPDLAALRDAVAKGADDKTVAGLMDQAMSSSQNFLPEVQSAGLEYAMGKGDLFKKMDSMIAGFYDKMTAFPAEVLSRNPLFFSLYRQHVSEMWQAAKDQGIDKLTPQMQQQYANQARSLALKDVKKFTYNMDFESKLAHNMRFIAPFFGPMQNAFSRWTRIAMDKPDIIAHSADIFTAPIRAGHAVDNEGNTVGEDGYATRPDGTRYLVPKSDMHIQFQAPQWLAKSIGMDQGSIIDMPINTLNVALQNDPWYNPGMGPWVQLPANWAALKGDPKFGDAMQKLGILQQVSPDVKSTLLGSGPSSVYAVLGGEDKDQQQKDMAYIMQAEDYKWKSGLRDTQPTWQEVKDRVEHGAYLRALMKTTLPVSANFKDPYEFFRNQYKILQQANPKTADQIFLARFGDAAFAFTGALTHDKKGLPSTREAVLADQKYSYLTDQNPDLASLIVGPQAQGQFSQTAYAQQLASGERTKLSAQEIMDKSNENAGWAAYQKYMNIMTSKLYQAGFKSFSEKGAEQFNTQRKAVISSLTNPTLPNGKVNPYYNEAFSKVFLTQDKGKQDRLAASLNQLVTEKGLADDHMRQDIQGLIQYMVWRNAATSVLNAREKAGGSKDINANGNFDIKQGFHNATMSLIEGNTMFQSLHDRWLSHDMFNHYDPSLNGAVI